MHFLSVLVRCKDEPFVDEFVKHYLREGVDFIYIIDDDSSLLYSLEIRDNNQVKIFYEKDIINKNIASTIYNQIKRETKWLIYVDIDEFITTKKNFFNSIRKELETTFLNVDCIKVPWVMMSANGREKNPKSLLKETVWRWNHDKRHENKLTNIHKFRCRYDEIEVKSIFKPSQFNDIWDHHPKELLNHNIVCVESVYSKPSDLTPFYSNLREKDIEEAYLVCYHFRVISKENSLEKIKNNIWYSDFMIKDLMSTDYAEVYDETFQKKLV
jgi:hypothetical protein